MKKEKIILYIGGILMCLSLFSGCFNKKQKNEKEYVKIDIENTIEFSFNNLAGNYANGRIIYEIKLEESKYIASYKPDGIEDEEKYVKEITKEDVLRLEEILTNCEIYKWNGFHESDPDVLDGHDFSIYYRREDKVSISASGYERYPEGYRDTREKIEEYFKDIFKDEIKKQD